MEVAIEIDGPKQPGLVSLDRENVKAGDQRIGTLKLLVLGPAQKPDEGFC